MKWKHFPRNWPFVRGIHRSPVNSPHKGQWRGALMFSLICIWINGWVNNHEAGDLRCYHACYDVTLMWHISCNPDQVVLILNLPIDDFYYDSIRNKLLSFVFSPSFRLIMIGICGMQSANQAHRIGSELIAVGSFLELGLGAKAPGHQYPQWWLNIHWIGLIQWRNDTFIVNSSKNEIIIWKKYTVV